ncbi:thermonuclease family protein [Rummeliibacillus pycnus]|uniref:thermonuclease family protein n=1 Tax=Rummeliibacillus pycnus TaxID=101070 RepID=UPI000C9BACFB|nr:thermonuclease family protein [Rummeliibacillus pycnus]
MKIWLILLCSFVFLTLAGCTIGQSSKSTKNANRVSVKVLSVMDGDTIKVKYKGEIKKVRYLLVDAPEMYHKKLGEQPFGREAQTRNREILNNAKDVALEFDVGDKEDKYGRLLAYVYADGKSVQEQLIREGLVRVGYIYKPNTKYLDTFKKIQEKAKNEKKDIWKYEGYVTDRGFVKSVVKDWRPGKDSTKGLSTKTTNQSQNNSTSSNNGMCKIKGNINSKGKKLYHLPGMNNYDAVKAEQMFCTEEEAQKAGFTKAS